MTQAFTATASMRTQARQRKGNGFRGRERRGNHLDPRQHHRFSGGLSDDFAGGGSRSRDDSQSVYSARDPALMIPVPDGVRGSDAVCAGPGTIASNRVAVTPYYPGSHQRSLPGSSRKLRVKASSSAKTPQTVAEFTPSSYTPAADRTEMELFQELLSNSVCKTVYHTRKMFLKPVVEEDIRAVVKRRKVLECSIEWKFNYPLTTDQKKALPQAVVVAGSRDNCILVRGCACGSSKEAARKDAVKDLLTHLGIPTMGELAEVYDWLLGQKKSQVNGFVQETVSKQSTGQVFCDIAWFWRECPSASPFVVRAAGQSPAEAIVRARADVLSRLNSGTLAPPVVSNKKTDAVAVCSVKPPSCMDDVPDTFSEKSRGNNSTPDPISGLQSDDISDIMQRSQAVIVRCGIEEKCTFVTEKKRPPTCEIVWTFMTDKGHLKTASATAPGLHKRAARASARARLLEDLGIVEAVSCSERAEARSIKTLLANNDVVAAIQRSAIFLRNSSAEGWNLLLPTVWRAALATYNEEYCRALILPLVDTTQGKGQGSASPTIDVNCKSRRLSIHLWETLLDASSILSNGRVGYNTIAFLSGGASYNHADKPERLDGVQLNLDASYFPSYRILQYFQLFRAMLAFEFRAEMSTQNGARRCEDRARNLWYEPANEATALYIELRALQKLRTGLRLQTKLTSEVDRFLHHFNIKDDDYALLIPGDPGAEEAWNNACVVRIASVAVKGSHLDMFAKLATDESLGQCLSASVFRLYALSTSVSLERMVNALRTLCLSRWPLTEKQCERNFSLPMRYILLNPETAAAKDVAQRGQVPVEFLQSFTASTESGIVTLRGRRFHDSLDPEVIPRDVNRKTSRRAVALSGSKGLLPLCPETLLGGTPGFDSLTLQQRRAVIAAVTNRLTLIQGPPGTGKTHTACAVIDVWNKAQPHRKILAVADSNVAADNLSEGLTRRGIRSARVGAGSDIDVQTYFRSHQRSLEGAYDTDFSRQKAFKYERMRLFRQLIASHQVVITTCVGSGHPMFEEFEFDRVIIDECAHSTEPASLIPLSRGCSALVLIGDYQQLAATVLSREAAERGLSTSLMERLAKSNISPVYLLDVQRRMHPSIAEFPNFQFYEGRLRNEDVNDRTRPPIRGFVFPNPAIRVCLLKVQPRRNTAAGLETIETSKVDNGTGYRHTASRFNTAEAQMVVPILESIFRHNGLTPSQIGILTPYAAQKRLIRRYLVQKYTSAALAGLDIDTVDGFQGKEKDLIIFSAVRSNVKGDVGFLSDGRRMNVMLTRARRGLIVIADPDTLQCEKTNWSTWLQWVTSRKAVIPSERLREFLGCSHPDPHAAEEIARAVCENRLPNLWRSTARESSAETAATAPAAPPSALPSSSHNGFFVDRNIDDSDDDAEDWYGEKAAAATAAALTAGT